MSEKKSQVRNVRTKRGKGNFMAIYHDIEEISYGPLCGLPAVARVFLCIRHKLLRDGLGQKPIGHSFIVERTGLTKRQVVACAQKLEASGIILIKADYRETAQGRIQFFENKYELNPKIFDEDYNWYANNPTLRAYSSDREASGSYSRKGISPKGIKSGGAKSDTRGGAKSDTRVVSDLVPGTSNTLLELLDKARSKNPILNNPKEKNPTEAGNFNFSGKGRGEPARGIRTQEEHVALIKKQVALAKQGLL